MYHSPIARNAMTAYRKTVSAEHNKNLDNLAKTVAQRKALQMQEDLLRKALDRSEKLLNDLDMELRR